MPQDRPLFSSDRGFDVANRARPPNSRRPSGVVRKKLTKFFVSVAIRRVGSKRSSNSRGNGSVTMMKAPTGTTLRRIQPNGPTCEMPLASST